ncbi:MAG: hypothetical protein H0T79_18150 [Deltaproteobacteria bacterium]|nr:hypothetical protein [Deltaproteobacteria bacterium]
MFATLDDQATHATLAEIHKVVGTLSTSVNVQASEWIGMSLWWWPVGSAPEPFTLDTVPAALAARLR